MSFLERKSLELKERVEYFTSNYNPIFSYTINQGELQTLSDNNYKTCRFCGESYPEVTFRKVAHAIPELLGNKEIVSKNECDKCNYHFGEMMEDSLAKYLGLNRTIWQIRSKEGVPSYKSKDGRCRVDFTNQGLVIQDVEGSNFVDFEDNQIIIHAVRQPYSPISVYKALVKMALSMIPYEYLAYFLDTLDWLQEKSNLVSKYNMKNYEWIVERFVPGPRPLELKVTGFIRGNETMNVPYYQFVLEVSNLIFQIAVPCKTKDVFLIGNDVEICVCPNEVDFMLNPFGSIDTQIKSMVNPNKVENEKFDVCLGFISSEMNGGNGMTKEEFFQMQNIVFKKKK